ncbi:MAG: TetR/AcrR family transcriptional regulator [Labilithrix sp.]|nr:TetR/AcrR family transcriptional regulator [Labilithrix sp.]
MIDATNPRVLVSNAMKKAKKSAYHHGDLARALVTAAVDLIAKEGPDALTLREVAAAVGVTHAAAYRHFADKEALLAAVAEEGYRGLAKSLGKAALSAETEPRKRLRRLGAAYVEFAMDRTAHYRVMAGPRLNEDGRFPSLERAIADAFASVLHEIERGQDAGVFREGAARDLAIAVWIAAHGYVDLVLRRRLKVKSAKVAVDYFLTLFDPFVDGLARAPSATRAPRREEKRRS